VHSVRTNKAGCILARISTPPRAVERLPCEVCSHKQIREAPGETLAPAGAAESAPPPPRNRPDSKVKLLTHFRFYAKYGRCTIGSRIGTHQLRDALDVLGLRQHVERL